MHYIVICLFLIIKEKYFIVIVHGYYIIIFAVYRIPKIIFRVLHDQIRLTLVAVIEHHVRPCCNA